MSTQRGRDRWKHIHRPPQGQPVVARTIDTVHETTIPPPPPTSSSNNERRLVVLTMIRRRAFGRPPSDTGLRLRPRRRWRKISLTHRLPQTAPGPGSQESLPSAAYAFCGAVRSKRCVGQNVVDMLRVRNNRVSPKRYFCFRWHFTKVKTFIL